MSNRTKKITRDFTLNFFSIGLVTIVTQFILFPYFANNGSQKDFGIIVLIIGYVKMSFAVFGNTLCTTRQILNQKNVNIIDKGDIHLLAIFSSIFGCLVVMSAVYAQNLSISPLNRFLLPIYIIIGILKAYYVSYYRINLYFNRQLISNIFMVLGYGFSFFIIKGITNWILPFFVGEFLSFIYVLYSTNYWKEKFLITAFFSKILKTLIPFILISLLGNGIAYFDRLVMYPIIGAELLAIFTVASFLGRTLGIVLNPLSNVLLSHFIQHDFVLDKKKYILLFLMGFIIVILFSLFSWAVGPLIIKTLYPNYLEFVTPFLLIAPFSISIMNSVCFIKPFTIAKQKPLFILLGQVIHFVSHILLSIWLYFKLDLQGLFLALLISGFIYSFYIFGIGWNILPASRNGRNYVNSRS